MARRKLTAKPEIDFSGLPDLTANQLAFVRGILDGKSASDSYRMAYDVSNSGKNTIWVEASRLRNHPHVSLWLSRAREAEMGHANITLEQHIQRLDALKQMAIETGNIGAAVQAEQIIGKVKGYHVERFEDVSRSDAMSALDELAKLSPEAAKALAQEHNIQLPDDTVH